MNPVEVEEFADHWRRWEAQRRHATRIGRAIGRARTPARLYSVRAHRRRNMLRLVEQHAAAARGDVLL